MNLYSFKVRKSEESFAHLARDMFQIYLSKDLAPQKFLSSTYCHLIYVVSGKGKVRCNDELIDYKGCLISGLHTKVLQYIVEEPITFVGITLYPPGVNKMFGIEMHNLLNRMVPLNQIVSQGEWLELLGKLIPSLSNDNFDLLSSAMNSQAKDISTYRTYIEQCIDKVRASNGIINIDDLISHRVSNRNLEVLFRKEVGVSPKRYIKLFRFYSMLKTFIHNGCPQYKELGDIYGYYDYSHFYKDFIRYIGESPKQFRNSEYILIKELYKHLSRPEV